MKRYIKIYMTILKINFANLLSYRVNFFIKICTNLGWASIGVVNMLILTSKTASAYGWSRGELIILAGTYPIFISVFYLLFALNLGDIPDTINRGDLDGFILKPIDSQFLLSTLRIDFTQIVRMIGGILVVFAFINIFHIHVNSLSIFLTLILFAFGITLVYSVWFGILTLSLWFTTLSNLRDLLYFSNGILRYPTELFWKHKNIFLYVISIFTFALSIPLKSLFEKMQITDLLLLLFFSMGLFLASRYFWKFALRSYVSASS